MLARSQAGRLCSRCRFDLLSLFENGFCNARSPLRNRLSRSARSPSHRPPHRLFATSIPQLQNQPAGSVQPRVGHDEDAALEQADISEDQLAALRDLEKVLGRPVGDAIEEDEIRALVAEAEAKLEDEEEVIEGEEEDQDAFAQEPSDEPLIALREAGASSADVAREARQVFGEYLPDEVLLEDESRIYKRMYGEPLSKEEFEEMEEDVDVSETEESPRGELLDGRGKPVELGLGHSKTIDDNPRTAEIQRNTPDNQAQAVADLLGGEYGLEEEDVLDEGNLDPNDRWHPMTALGKSGTRPSTVSLPRDTYVEPLANIMSDYSNKQLKDTSERVFGGPGLPDSPLTPRSGRSRKQVPVALQASQIFMGEMEANVYLTTVMPPAYAAVTSVLTETRKRLGQTWLTELLARPGGPRVLDAGAAGAGILALNEIVRAHWESLHSSDASPPQPPPSKTVVLTGSDPLRHRSAALLENTTFIPRLPDYVHVRDKPTLEDDRSTQQRKEFDVIISSYSLLPFKEDWERKQYVQNLWTLLSSSGGVLVLLEKGMPRGFESIAGARDMLLERYIATPTAQNTRHATTQLQDNEGAVHKPSPSMIIAPCTNHERCPMYRIPGEARSRKDYCSFQQRYIRPTHLQRVLGARDRNHDDVDFSYISVLKGRDLREHQYNNWNHLSDPLSSPATVPGAQSQAHSNSEQWMEACKTGFNSITPESVSDTSTPGTGLPPTHLLPRLVFPPMKRQGHVLLDVCTPRGTLERWTVPKSFSKQAFRDSRKARWGDIWALGAKTRIPRKVRLGGPDSEENKALRNKAEKQRKRATDILDKREEEKEAAESEPGAYGDSMSRYADEGDEDQEGFSDDIVDQVWQDMGIGQVERQAKRPTARTQAEKPSVPPVTSQRRPASIEAAPSKPRSAEEIETSRAMAAWAEEFDEKVLARSEKNFPGRVTKGMTRKMKRKYREARRNGDLVQEGSVSK